MIQAKGISNTFVIHTLKKLLTYLLIIGVLTTCASVRNTNASINVTKLSETNLNRISAIYKNKAIEGEPEFSSLWSTLNFQADSIENWKDMNVKISLINNKSIKTELIYNGKVIAEKSIKGNLKKDFFLLKNQTKAEVGIVVVWFLANSSVKIGLSENNELVLLRRSDGLALLVAFPIFGANSPTIETKYERIE